MTKFTFRDEPLFLQKQDRRAKPSAQRIGEALEKIAAANGGQLTPAATVIAAQPAGAYLHRFFEWDDPTAAGKYREDQARSLIRCIRVVEDEKPEAKHIAFVSVPTGNGRAYVSRDSVLTNVFWQARVIAQAEKDLQAFERRYSELVSLCQDIRTLREKLSDRRRQLLDDGPPDRRLYGT